MFPPGYWSPSYWAPFYWAGRGASPPSGPFALASFAPFRAGQASGDSSSPGVGKASSFAPGAAAADCENP